MNKQTESHVTIIVDRMDCRSLLERSDNGGPYTAICVCKWQSAGWSTRRDAVSAARAHRTNARIQEENAC